MKTFIGLTLLALLLSSCATVAPPRPEFTDLPPLENGWGRILVFAGNWKSILPDQALKGPYRTGPVYVNEREVGVIAYQEYIAIDLLPGTYGVYWKTSIPDKMFSEKLLIDIKENQTRYFSCDMTTFGSGAAFGLIGALASDYNTRGWLVETPLDSNEKLVSYYKFKGGSSSVSMSTQEITSPSKSERSLKKNEQTTLDEQSIYNRLAKLKELFKNELITKEEYDAERQELLDKL